MKMFRTGFSGREGLVMCCALFLAGVALCEQESRRTGERAEAKLASGGAYGLAVGSDGALYAGGVGPGNLYRYDPATNELRNLGGKQFGAKYIWSCAASRDGRVYCACYPGCNVLEYCIATNTLRDLGPIVKGEKYARSVCVDAFGKVWVGVGTHAHLVVLDPKTGEKKDVLPQQYRGDSLCYDLGASGN